MARGKTSDAIRKLIELKPKNARVLKEEREIEIEYLTHDMAEVGKGIEEAELVIRELHQEFKDKDKVEITEVQETIF